MNEYWHTHYFIYITTYEIEGNIFLAELDSIKLYSGRISKFWEKTICELASSVFKNITNNTNQSKSPVQSINNNVT